ncbi:MAG: DUF1844 domain-containing protein [Nitrospiria bacterium]
MEEESSFVVRDRRASYAEETEAPPVSKEPPPKPDSSEKKPASDVDKAEQPEQTKKINTGSHHVPVNFSSFVLSLATSAFIHLGEEADPATGQKSVDLPNARQVIDLITMLGEKTQGNLSKEEEHLVGQLLYTMRMKYVALEKGPRT